MGGFSFLGSCKAEPTYTAHRFKGGVDGIDIRAYDRAQDAFNLANKDPVQQKVMVFIIPSRVKLGVVPTEVRFPYAGHILSVYASCGTAGATPTAIALEKCSQDAYDTVPSWENVMYMDMLLDANEKSTNTASVLPQVGDTNVSPNDHFRVNVVGLGAGVTDITVEVVVAI